MNMWRRVSSSLLKQPCILVGSSLPLFEYLRMDSPDLKASFAEHATNSLGSTTWANGIHILPLR